VKGIFDKISKEWFFICCIVFFIIGLTQSDKTCYICSVICFCTGIILREIRKKDINALISIQTISEESLKILKKMGHDGIDREIRPNDELKELVGSIRRQMSIAKAKNTPINPQHIIEKIDGVI
jgi:hypothetical protein